MGSRDFANMYALYAYITDTIMRILSGVSWKMYLLTETFQCLKRAIACTRFLGRLIFEIFHFFLHSFSLFE